MAALPAAKLASGKPVLRAAGQNYLRDAMRERPTTVAARARELGVSRKHLSGVGKERASAADRPAAGSGVPALGIAPAFLVCLLDYGLRVEPAPHGFMKGRLA